MRKYAAAQGDTWDYLSHKLYKDSGLAHILLKANPHLRHIALFESPQEISVPDAPQAAHARGENLPPWKRP